MNDELSENAVLHVLGLLTGPEEEAFARRLREDGSLREEVCRLRDAMLVIGIGGPPHHPPPELREKILSDFARRAAQAKAGGMPGHESASGPAAEETSPPGTNAAAGGPAPVLPAPVRLPRPSSPVAGPSEFRSISAGTRLLRLLPWAAAAALAVLYGRTHFSGVERDRELAGLRADHTDLAEKQTYYLDALKAAESSKVQTEASLASARAALENAEAKVREAGRQQSLITEELAALRQRNPLSHLRVAVMESLLKNRPKAVAVSLWRQESQEGVLVVENLPTLPPGRDYQLWVIDPDRQTPVSAGVFKVDAEGRVRLEFKPAQPVATASKFAVTEEKEGGSPTPHLDKLVVMGD